MSPVQPLWVLLAAVAAALCGCGLPASCEAQSDCPQATVCALGQCRLECPCGSGEACVDGACYTQQCDSGLVCAAGTVCVGDVCGDPLCGGQDCGDGFCDEATRACVQCLGDAQCPAETPTCHDGRCACIPSGSAEQNCGDGRDDNCDGRIDCADEAYCRDRPCAQNTGTCRGTTCCVPTEQAETQCGDGIDNDCDGDTDCADLNCAGVTCSDSCGNAAVCTAGVCPDHGLKPQGTECRAAAGPCDAAEQCTGTSARCPEDVLAPATRVCRPENAALGCDAEERCTGASRECPEDAAKAAGVVCRPALDATCDIAESCDGTRLACPQDQVVPKGTACVGVGNGRLCDAPDGCDGRGRCEDLFRPGGELCRPSVDVRCDPAERCTGTSGDCPQDAHIAANSSCTPDGNDCTTEVCNAEKKCVTGVVPDNGACLDGSGNSCCGGAAACFDLRTDPDNCGVCGRQCDTAQACTQGACCTQCEDDPPGSLCCGNRKCVRKGTSTNPLHLCE